MDLPVRLLIVDDHPALRYGLAALLQREPDILVVGEASNGMDAVEKALALKPSVILMDLALPKKSGLEAIKEILVESPGIQILIFTSSSDGDQILAGIRAGALGYLIKDSSPQEIFNAIRNAHQGRPSLNPAIELSLLHQIQHERTQNQAIAALTEREIEILRWLAAGLTDSEIAQRACITEGTVRSHISNMLNKLGLCNRPQAVIYAIQNGLTKMDAEK